MTQDELTQLYQKWLNQEISDEEIEVLLKADHPDEQNSAVSDMVDDYLEKDDTYSPYYLLRATRLAENAREVLMTQIAARKSESRLLSFFRRYTSYVAAACVLCVAAGGAWIWKISEEVDKGVIITDRPSEDLPPGGSRAVLVLENGTEVPLRSDKNGVIMQGEALQYADGVAVTTAETKVYMQTIRVPKGGEYKITLADGTTVHLNSDSELTFPSRFNTASREVALRGEGYFEVTKTFMPDQRRQAFMVHTTRQTIEVLGTKFNVYAYPEERVERTVLAEGKVNVHTMDGEQGLMLRPKQQAIWNGKTLWQESVDLEVALAWTRGEFYFQHLDLIQIMRQLERWYAVEVIFNGPVTGSFGGKISKSKTLAEVLEMLESTNAFKCKVVGRRIYVTD